MGQVLVMAGAILLDTDVLVDFFRGYSKAVTFVNAYSSQIILSSIVIAELYAGVKGDAEQTALENFVSLFRIIPVTTEIAKIGGSLQVRLWQVSRCRARRRNLGCYL